MGGEAGTRGCGLPSYTRKVELAFIQTRMKDFTHIPQLQNRGRASKFEEGSASPFLRRAHPQYLSTSNTFGADFRIQAQLLSPFVCQFGRSAPSASRAKPSPVHTKNGLKVRIE